MTILFVSNKQIAQVSNMSIIQRFHCTPYSSFTLQSQFPTSINTQNFRRRLKPNFDKKSRYRQTDFIHEYKLTVRDKRASWQEHPFSTQICLSTKARFMMIAHTLYCTSMIETVSRILLKQNRECILSTRLGEVLYVIRYESRFWAYLI